jgi:hypothetical protein
MNDSGLGVLCRGNSGEEKSVTNKEEYYDEKIRILQ